MNREAQPRRNFIVLEGLDGAGTTTQRERLVARLRAAAKTVYETCEPSDGVIGRLIRTVLRKETPLDPRSLALLFAADRNEHLFAARDGMIARLDAGEVVVCDRYLFSSLAYQSIDCGYAFVRRLNQRFPLPELLLFVDVTPEECQRRLASRPGVELFEGIELQERILKAYERGMRDLAHPGMRRIRIDGMQPVEAVEENIWSVVSSLPIVEA